ncbi:MULTISPECIES: heavy metal transport/detoxification protein [Cyanophyceae]|uniref:heavy metal transport/detoxification protein n=1 Tax=Cyanophyceae TaxID=3028117 RepID=UPI0016825EBF|nr:MULTISPECIES: heavy metal transport/detoxification protein [Cyanophyceae]MBD1915864.1 heavy metal transport/detoxification protein [Phormidium sp. FACHB-77]MBD2030462.1 heavy metal transport/detoxification protein [Phormidium sp. FACHB-322]MBD2053464.1 heavy metal transport/detoxification protein [Leptolyngbya sp. FACHB-60]
MILVLQVPTLGDQESAQELKDLILTTEPEANIDINTQAKTVTIDSEASAETFKQLITASGHSVTLVDDPEVGLSIA